jgi:predicted metalloprotease with PDZ domain
VSLKKGKTILGKTIKRLHYFFVRFALLAWSLPLVAQPSLKYSLSLQNPTAHLLHVELTVQARDKHIDFSLPAWAPGSYVIMNYAKYLQEFSARNAAGQALPWEKIDKQTWRVSGYKSSQLLTVSYRIYAAVLSDTQSEFNEEHAHVFGPQVFLYPVNAKEQAIRLVVHRPAHWRIATGLQTIDDSTFAAPNYDVFIDAPLEIGEFIEERFEAAGAVFRLVAHGEPERWRITSFAEKLQKIVAEQLAIMGGPPFREYVFCWHVDPRADYFGLEHFNSTCIGMPHRLGDQSHAGDDWDHYEGLTDEDIDLDYAAHEFFHLWNVKRLRPIELGPFDYTREVYTTGLWIAEGMTDYYAYLTLIRSGLWTKRKWLQKYSNAISRYRRETGWKYRSPRELSRDAWLWAYGKGDQGNLRQTYFSFYTAGDLIALCMDLRIRYETQSAKSLDDVFRALLQRFGYPKPGFTEEQFWQMVAMVSGLQWDDFRNRYVAGREELPLDEYLSDAGIVVDTVSDTNAPYLGISIKDDNGQVVISSLTPGSPAVQAGLDVDDKLLAVNSDAVTSENWQELLHRHRPGATITLLISRRGQVRTLTAILGRQPAFDFILSLDEDAPAAATELREKWWSSVVSSK